MWGQVNPAYDGNGEGEVTKISVRPVSTPNNGVSISTITKSKEELIIEDDAESGESRAQWSNGVEFLMSCIAMSVGLGNIWRFPFTAYENGGGAFLIPYIIVLIVIGRPLYYMEMALGQFSARGNVKMFRGMTPAFVGVGYGQVISTFSVITYYCSLMAMTLYYFYLSLAAELPWAKCSPEWGDTCFDSALGGISINATNRKSSSELYFIKTVLHEKNDISDGIGLPDWRLCLCLFISWVTVYIVASRGIKSSGKVSYFLAIFPYIVLTTLLIRALSLPGALDGIVFFVRPEWSKLLTPEVWYAAVTQAFFSLGVCFGPIIVYSSYNDFNHNISRDAMVVTTLDTFTSLLAGSTIFGILGNLAHESGTNIQNVVKGGTGLAFVSYPEAIAKFTWCPQIFAVLFFLMLFILGIGSLVAYESVISTAIKDQFPNLKDWQVAAGTATFSFLIGLVYTTPGGQAVLNLIDYFGGTFIVFILAIFQIACVSWVYGLGNFCLDLEFMLNRKVGIYWRLCWGVIAPVFLIIILLYSLITATSVTYQDIPYPTEALAAGWVLLAVGVAQLPLWGLWLLYKKRDEHPVWEAIFKPSKEWCPKNPAQNLAWREFKRKAKEELELRNETRLQHIVNVLFGR